MIVEHTRLHRPAAALAVIVAVVACYWGTLHSPFLFDDRDAVELNPTIRELFSLRVFDPPPEGGATTGRPLVNLSFAINYAISGERTWSYHAGNMALHAVAALVLMGTVRRTLALPALRARWGDLADPIGFLVAILWAVHPLQTESVTCIAQRTELLGGLFILLTLHGFVRGVAEGRDAGRSWLAGSVAACLAGMASKEIVVVAPVLVLFYDRMLVSGTFADALRRRTGYYSALAATWLLLAVLLLRGGGTRGAAAGLGLGVSPWHYLLTQADALVTYLRLVVWPYPLIVDRGTDLVTSPVQVWWQGALILTLLVVTIVALVRRWPAAMSGVWFFGILAPSSSVVPLITQTVAEHRMYLPLAGVLALLVPAAAIRLRGGVARTVAMVVVAICATLTVVRNRDYRDPVVLWTATVGHVSGNARAHNNLGWALHQRGDHSRALTHFERATGLAPAYTPAHYNRGVVLLGLGRTEEGADALKRAIELAPDHVDAHAHLGNAWVLLGRPDQAIAQFRQALAIGGPAADVHYNMGVALRRAGRQSEAHAELEQALSLDPALVAAHLELARLAEDAGRESEAMRRYREALRIDPDHAPAHRAAGMLAARAGRLAEATTHFREVVRIEPRDADGQANLGNALLLGGRVPEAIEAYEAALRLRPGDPRVLENLALAREALAR